MQCGQHQQLGIHTNSLKSETSSFQLVSDLYAKCWNYRYLRSDTADNRYRHPIIWIMHLVCLQYMRNNMSVGDHVTALSCQSSSLGLASIT